MTATDLDPGKLGQFVGPGTMWGEQKADEMHRAAGFTSVVTTGVPDDTLTVYCVCRKDPAVTASSDEATS